MYVRGAEPLTNNLNVESLLLSELEQEHTEEPAADANKKSNQKGEEEPQFKPVIPIMVNLYSIGSAKNGADYNTAEKVIHIGCMKMNSGVGKKEVKRNGDFLFEPFKEINLKGFNIDQSKVSFYFKKYSILFRNSLIYFLRNFQSAVEAGGERAVKITWKPNPGMDVRAI
jgi:hypothetical protein